VCANEVSIYKLLLVGKVGISRYKSRYPFDHYLVIHSGHGQGGAIGHMFPGKLVIG
jgi:hypothetical protein